MSAPAGAPAPAGDRRPTRNHLAWSVVSLLLFPPLGIPAVVKAARVNTLLAAGDHAGAQRAAEAARTWALSATLVGVIVWVLSCCPLGVLVAADPTAVASWVADLTDRP